MHTDHTESQRLQHIKEQNKNSLTTVLTKALREVQDVDLSRISIPWARTAILTMYDRNGARTECYLTIALGADNPNQTITKENPYGFGILIETKQNSNLTRQFIANPASVSGYQDLDTAVGFRWWRINRNRDLVLDATALVMINDSRVFSGLGIGSTLVIQGEKIADTMIQKIGKNIGVHHYKITITDVSNNNWTSKLIEKNSGLSQSNSPHSSLLQAYKRDPIYKTIWTRSGLII